MTYGVDRQLVSCTIPSGASLSDEVNVGSRTIVGVIMPAGWDAAGITFQALVREPSANPKVPVFGNVQDESGTEFTITTPIQDEYVAITATKLVALGRVKVRSGTAGAAVNQTANRTITLVLAG